MKKTKKVAATRPAAKKQASRKSPASKSAATRALPLNDGPALRKTWQPPGPPVGLGRPAFRYPPA